MASRISHNALRSSYSFSRWIVIRASGTPTAANYFRRIGKAKTLETLRKVKGSVAPSPLSFQLN
jgi:hypothetical protein